MQIMLNKNYTAEIDSEDIGKILAHSEVWYVRLKTWVKEDWTLGERVIKN